MSVAFRRESDEEHLEPKFELPIPAGPNLVTPHGLKQIEAKVAGLETAATAETDEEARKGLQRDLRYWRTRLATAEPAPDLDEGQAGIGTTVTFRLNGATRTIHIVGHDEADPTADRLAFSAPLARAMMGAYEGEAVDYQGKEEALEILSVTPTDQKEA